VILAQKAVRGKTIYSNKKEWGIDFGNHPVTNRNMEFSGDEYRNITTKEPKLQSSDTDMMQEKP
jgi:hypothetical protein